ncbi:MAG: O-antigen ligase family protein, partial [Stenotrophobium sp.]
SWLLAASLVFAPLTSLRVYEMLGVCDVLFIAAVGVGVIERMFYREPMQVVPIYLLAALLFIASYLANLGQGQDDPNYDKYFYILLINAVLIPCATLLIRIRSPGEMRFLIYAWTFGAFYGAAFAVLYCKGFIPGHYEYYWTHLGRVQGLTPHPNVQALNSVLLVPGLLMMFCIHRSPWLRGLIVAMLVVAWQAIDYSGSRVTIVMFVLMILVFAFLFFLQATARQRTWIIRGLLVLTLVALVVFAIVSIGPPRPQSALWRLFYAHHLSSNDDRAKYNGWAWAGFMAAPLFGQGYQWSRVAHNIYLQQLHTAGIVGLLAYLITLLTPGFYLLRSALIGRDRLLTLTLATSNIVLLVAAIYWSSYTDLNVTYVFCLALYAGGLLSRPDGQVAQSSPTVERSLQGPATS